GDGKGFWGPTVGWAGPIEFTGDEHDSESNLEHTLFRQYSSAQSRWTTPDPYLGSMDLGNPQSFNRYSYAMNDPMNSVRLLGLDGGCSDTQKGGGSLRGCSDGARAPFDLGWGAGAYLDGAWIPDDLLALLAPSESVNAFEVGGFFADMHLDQNGYPFDPFNN